jgi:hypothetical protein
MSHLSLRSPCRGVDSVSSLLGALPPLLPSLPSSIMSCHNPKSPCSAGKTTPGAATEPASPVRSCSQAPLSTTLPSSQATLIADLPRPSWLLVPAGGIPMRPPRTTDAAGLSPVVLPLVGCSPVLLGGSRSAGRQRLFASRPLAAVAPAAPRSQIFSHDSKSPCSAGKATSGAAAEFLCAAGTTAPTGRPV